MKLWRYIAGTMTVQITCADPIMILSVVNQSGVPLFDVVYENDLTISAKIYQFSLNRILIIVGKYGGELKVQSKQGLYWNIIHATHRPVLFFGCLFLILLTIFLPSRIFFVNVEGNKEIPTQLILDKASDIGIRFGTSRRYVRSEKVKNALISEIPSLQWVGINTTGCVATISVQEKAESDAEDSLKYCVGNIVAKRDGIIISCTVLRGTPLCETGQAVTAGQTLISGYTDCGICIQATCAEGEILAQTQHALQLVTPIKYIERGMRSYTMVRYGLRIGKKVINFYKGSGISDPTCVKMYQEDYLNLPGGFLLPIAVISEHLYYYDTRPCEADALDWINEYSRDFLVKSMCAGEIVTDSMRFDRLDDFIVLDGKFDCIEMIGQLKREENPSYYGDDN